MILTQHSLRNAVLRSQFSNDAVGDLCRCSVSKTRNLRKYFKNKGRFVLCCHLRFYQTVFRTYGIDQYETSMVSVRADDMGRIGALRDV